MPWIDSSNPPDPRHPIVAAALSARGVDAKDVVAHESWKDRRTQQFGDLSKQMPRVTCNPESVRVLMPTRPDGIEPVFYMEEDLDADRATFWTHELEFRGWTLPETVLCAMTGREVDQIADVPGAAGLVVDHAYMMPKGVCLKLVHPLPANHEDLA